MASKAKTLQVKDKEKEDKAADTPEKDSAGLSLTCCSAIAL